MNGSPSSMNIRQEKGTRSQIFGPDIFRWGGGLPREGVGAEKFGMSFATEGNRIFWPDITGVAEKIEKTIVFNSCSRMNCMVFMTGVMLLV